VLDGAGNAERGQLVFQFVNAQCQHCHTIEGWGGHFGPDLSHIGSSKSREQLIRAILQPSAEISPEWQGWFVTTKEGQTHYGRQIDVGFDEVEIMLPSGAFVTFDTPKSYGMAPTSLMPEGLENELTVSELNDLITYLKTLK
jgi:putative heme-binding domain-containing protein